MKLSIGSKAITGVAFLDTETLISVEASSNEAKFWDLRALSDFDQVTKSNENLSSLKQRKLPKYGEREERLLKGSL